ncbi:MAG: Gfo/Idh/MocA family protein [Phycisphaerae bacterium]
MSRKSSRVTRTRRQFLQRSAQAAAGLAAFTIVPAHVLGGPRHRPPSETLNIAAIGCGGQGGVDIQNLSSENIVALCDVDDARAAETFKKFPDAKRYKDFRVMLEKEKGIDAVLVATPDHVHAIAALTAIRAGKHVYVEKPMTYCVQEARMLQLAAKKAGVATQMGNQGRASEAMRLLKEWIEDGAIGTIREVHAWTTHAVWPQGLSRPKETPPVPATLDWDLWLGPAPERPYHPAYAPIYWRGWWDFGTGAMGDMGCHVLDAAFYALDLTPPTSVEASYSQAVPEGITWNKPFNGESYPQAAMIHYHFPARGKWPPIKITWYDGGLRPERPPELEPQRQLGNGFGGLLFVGEKGKIMCGAHGADGVRIIPETAMAAYRRPEKRLVRSVGHHAEWIAACKGGPACGSNFDYAGPLTEAVLLGNIALRYPQRLDWDADAMKITNVADANQWLMRMYRDGWNLEG